MDAERRTPMDQGETGNPAQMPADHSRARPADRCQGVRLCQLPASRPGRSPRTDPAVVMVDTTASAKLVVNLGRIMTALPYADRLGDDPLPAGK